MARGSIFAGHASPRETHRRVHLARRPMVDSDENGVMVYSGRNARERVVQSGAARISDTEQEEAKAEEAEPAVR